MKRQELRPLTEMLKTASKAAEARATSDALVEESQHQFGEIRRSLGISQAFLAEAIDKPVSYVSMVENQARTATPETLQKLYGAMDSYVKEGGLNARDQAKADAKKARG